MDLSLYFLYFSTYCIYCTHENCTKVYSFWKKRKKTWERQVHQNHVTGPFHRKIIFIVNSILGGGSHKWQCLIRIRIVPMYVLLHYFPQVELEVWKSIGGSHYDIGHDSLKGIFIKVCLQNFTREKDIYRGGHDELGRKLHTCI